MFTVKCGATFLWHPALHHSLLLLRALKQRHTLVLEPSIISDKSKCFPRRVSHGSDWLSIFPPSTEDGRTCAEVGDQTQLKENAVDTGCLSSHQTGLRCVCEPQHILHFLATPSHSRGGLKDQIQDYLDAVVVSNEVLRAVDDLLVGIGSNDMEITRQQHGAMFDVVARLDASLSMPMGGANEGVGAEQAEERWSTWPLFTTMQFLVEEAGLVLGPFPSVANVYNLLRESMAVVKHKRFIERTLETTREGGRCLSEITTWPWRGILPEVQRRLADYNADFTQQLAGVDATCEKVPLRTRACGARFGVQSFAARVPWPMQK
ncbi:hypothetical protein ERJ75_001043200 [Trypanosoma vivax]|uniref:Uncharacterized protein n=1 Tax=Trypanosoma vivax (strain Y486) TaxID=1055687 RepID=G0TZS2_TRYVY|nr:hypothetical protein TRVL_04380 [Trypanosoma vivax]KAH8611050.1 hypothetical protein ERJ75_001043200 [Trypanosoma vivax]CCC50100.1 conserved hypothetical protein [Trypanosoma vivax Y486]